MRISCERLDGVPYCNSNRDHVTAIVTNTGEDERMRNIFRCMAMAKQVHPVR
jgi:hypothetical protein